MKKLMTKLRLRNSLIILLLLVPLIVLLSYKLYGYKATINIWYYLILYIGIIGFVYGIYRIVKEIDLKKVSLKDKIPFILLIIFLIFAILSTLNSSNFMLSLMGSDYRKDGLYSYIAYIGVGLTSMFIMKAKEKNVIYKLFVIVGMILTIFTRFGLNDFLFPIQNSYNGIFFQFNHFSYFLILCLVCNTCLFITSKGKEAIIYMISYMFMLELLILNDTFGGYVAILLTTIFVIAYYIIVKKIKFKPIILLIIFTLLSFNVSNRDGVIVLKNFNINLGQLQSVDLSNIDKKEEIEKVKHLGTDRGRLWATCFRIIPKKPILGYGIENVENEFRKDGSDNDKPHNLILGLMVFIGIPGALALLTCFGLVVLRNIGKIKEIDDVTFIALAGTICYLMSSMFGNSMFYTQPYFSIFFGFLLSNIVKKYIKKDEY